MTGTIHPAALISALIATTTGATAFAGATGCTATWSIAITAA